MKLSNRAKAMLAGLVAALTLSVGPVLAEVTALNLLASGKDFPRVWREYPDMDARFERPGIARTPQQVQKVAIGSSKQQLVRAVGQPVSTYPDGSWNFNIALPLPQRNRLICQYRVFFDAQERVTGTIWRRPQCVQLVTGQRK